MVKLVDMPDLGSGAARRVGSSPIIRTKKASEKSEAFLFWRYSHFQISFSRVILCILMLITSILNIKQDPYIWFHLNFFYYEANN